jgi:arylsulfatase A-like enzyme
MRRIESIQGQTDVGMTGDALASNVVLVTVDSLRADAISHTADDRRTPEIGRLAESGTVFENAFALGNWTPFSFPSMLASRPVFAESDDIGLPETPVLAETLREAALQTGGFNASNGFLTPYWGYDRGFDAFESFIGGEDPSRYERYLAAHPTVHAWLQVLASPFRRIAHRIRYGKGSRPFTDTSRLLDVEGEAEDFVERATASDGGDPVGDEENEGADDGFFLWVHYMDAHTPYVPAPQHLREVSDGQFETHRLVRAHVRTGLGLGVGDRTLGDLRALYSGAIRQVDASVGRLRETLEEAGVADDTAFVVAGDHGEEFMEHGNLAHYPKLYDSLIHVPLIVSIPGIEGRHVEEAVGLDAIAPTVCDILGVDPPDVWEGESLRPTVTGETVPAGGPVVSVTVQGESVTQQPIPRRLDDGDLFASARTSDWTYIENTATGESELYHRASDADHQQDLSGSEVPPGVADRLASAVERHVDRLGGDATPEEPLDDAIATRLDALGYR